MTVRVLHADNHVLAVDKPAGTPVVPDSSGDASLLDAAKEWVADVHGKSGRVFLGVVHRLDRPVSGALVFARTSKAAARLTAAFRERRVAKRYLAVVEGVPAEGAGEVRHWLLKDRARNVVRVVDRSRDGAREARTRWRVVAARGGRALLEFEPETGRPHQLRVAAASLGAPLAGDLKYGAPAPLDDRSVALHARELALPHPTRPEEVRVVAELPAHGVWDLARDAAV